MTRGLITIVVAARPNFMKAGPVLRALEVDFDVDLVHTGQHYDRGLSGAFLDELDLPDPTVNLQIGSGSHAEQTAGVMVAFEKYLVEAGPDVVLVVGDVNSTIASALAATKMNIPVGHVEAGLRSRDWTMPEEVNRILTDQLSCWLFTPSADADANLVSEGISTERIHLVGNVMIDTLLTHLPEARRRQPGTIKRIGLGDHPYAILTLHRPATVDHPSVLAEAFAGIAGVAEELPVLFPVHPRTLSRMEGSGQSLPNGVMALEPLGYLDFLGLMDSAALVLTDSGGMQEETSVLGVPCLTMRPTTERPITVEAGTNRIVGTDPAVIRSAAREALAAEWGAADIPLWDGRAAERIAGVLRDWFDAGRPGEPGLCGKGGV
jgi:UDP-N-acetylglucosamine 2-epimerase (non-hydrolysing)